MSPTAHLTSQAPNRQHLPGPSVLFNGSLSFTEHLIHNLLPTAEAKCSEPFTQPHSGQERPPGHILGSHLSLYRQPTGLGMLWQGKHCRGVTDLPVRCSSSQSPWPPPPWPPSWGVSPFICTFSPPEYMFFLGQDTARQSTKRNPKEPSQLPAVLLCAYNIISKGTDFQEHPPSLKISPDLSK